MTDRDNITLPREVLQEALEALCHAVSRLDHEAAKTDCDFSIEALRTHLAAPKQEPKHPGYVIGSHWLETAYSRVCAGEAEADVLRDMGWERVDEALRRNAELWRKSRAKYIAWQKGGKAEAMENKT